MSEETLQLKGIISRLCDFKLIPGDEKLRILTRTKLSEIKAEMYDFLVKQDLAVALNVILAIRDFESDENNLKYPVKIGIQNMSHGVEKNAMQNTVVITRIFRFLGLADIKNCRLVNKNWDSIASPLLRKRSTIVFSRSALHNPHNFTETFLETLNTFPFRSFKFKEDWSISELTNFFGERRNDIKEICFVGLKLFNGNQFVPNYDISHWIENCLIIRLEVDGLVCDGSKTRLKVEFNAINSVKFITLQYCDVNVNQNSKMMPLELNLRWVTFYQGENKLNQVLVNNYINFNKMDKLSISCPSSIVPTVFDFAESTDMDQMEFRNVRMINWTDNSPKSKVKKLSLENVEFIQKNSSEIREIHFFKGTSVDLSALPPQLEKIYICNDDRDVAISCTQPSSLPGLRFLKLETRGSGNSLFALSNFSQCSNLVSIDISTTMSPSEDRNIILNLTWIPRSVKKLKITGHEVITGLSRDKQFILDRLVVDKCSSMSQAVNVLLKIKPTTLVIGFSLLSKQIDQFILFLQQFKIVKNIFVGTFDWNCINYEKSRLSYYVNKMANFYVFINQRGSAIDEHYFQNMASLEGTLRY